jgi:hypothetical protein
MQTAKESLALLLLSLELLAARASFEESWIARVSCRLWIAECSRFTWEPNRGEESMSNEQSAATPRYPSNDDPFATWNDPMHSDDPFAPWNDPMKQDDPFACWNDPFGHGDYEDDVEQYGERSW